MHNVHRLIFSISETIAFDNIWAIGKEGTKVEQKKISRTIAVLQVRALSPRESLYFRARTFIHET